MELSLYTLKQQQLKNNCSVLPPEFSESPDILRMYEWTFIVHLSNGVCNGMISVLHLQLLPFSEIH